MKHCSVKLLSWVKTVELCDVFVSFVKIKYSEVTKMKTAVIYTRHITARDYEATIAEQTSACKKYAEKTGIKVVNTYSDYFAQKQDLYPAFTEMLSDAKSASWDTIIVYQARILGRIFQKTLDLQRELRKVGKDLIFVDMEISGIGHILKELCKI